MTRPGIIRADTIDLQDQDAPSAKDHSKKHLPGALGYAAPHQAAELRHVQHERHVEEVALSNAWSSGQGLSDEPPSEDDDMYAEGEQLDADALLHQNGDLLGPADESDTGDDDDSLGDDMERASSSPSITDEDIDFDLVYALHNFVATVEGQANASKGDTMVLLDDSNSYWWLVRVVKDSTIGYLPAEHIETPTERLARLNKHRNIDATKMHFEDSLEKPKNPLKRAIRRRNQKQVAFAEPTYRDAPLYDYSTEEEDEEEGEGEESGGTNGQSAQSQTSQENRIEEDTDEITTVAPLNVRSAAGMTEPQSSQESAEQITDDEGRISADETVLGDETERVGSGISRKGTVRNTDSFFKDDSVETRKITITPKLLREDNGSVAEARTSDLGERGSSFDIDKLDRKEDKNVKKKNLFNIFKRKDKGDKKGNHDSISSTKTSSETSRDSVVTASGTSSPAERSLLDNSLQRKGSKGKLQKVQPNGQPRMTVSPNSLKPLQLSTNQGVSAASNGDSPREPVVATQRTSPDKQSMNSNTRQLRNAESTPATPQESSNPFADSTGISHVSRSVMQDGQTDALSESPVHITVEDAHPDGEPPALVRDTSSDSDDVRSLRDSPSPPVQKATARETQAHSGSPAAVHSLGSPISTSAATFGGAAIGAAAIGGAAMLAGSGGPPPPNRSPPPQPNGQIMPFGSLTSAASAPDRQNSTSTTTSAILSSAPSTPVWSDACLRQYLDESGSADIRDLLLLTRDTTGVVPVSHDHPLMAGLYAEERGQVKEMDAMLNGLLGTWLDRKVRSKSSMSQRKRAT